MRHRVALALLAVALALPVAVAACGGEDEGGNETTAAGSEPLQTIELTASEFEFDPDEITLDEAGTYRFVLTNDGDAEHALEIEGNGLEEETDVIEGGETAELEVSLDEGEYELYCPVGNHKDMGMVGRIVVGGGAGGGATTEDESETGETTTGDETEDEGETTTESGSGAGY